MIIEKEICIGCKRCQLYCPMECINYNENQRKCEIDLDECVECGICLRSNVCTTDALKQQELDEMRKLRQTFSNPLIPHKTTSVPGRGTEEMKTNDVTGRFRRGHVGVAIELGRPGTGTRFIDVEKVAMAVALIGVTFEMFNPVTDLMVNKATGKIKDDVLNEKVLSAIVEFDVDIDKLEKVLLATKQVANNVDTVFSVDLACRLDQDNTSPAESIAKKLGFEPYITGKTNVGLGRPLFKEGE
ncbi:4Fe-4S dicluster domain-containing protein [Schnuerera sp. xch1]|uniref:4Fe-4S dicluster domain-containing protein n=1 Tax=Schnuerera sp. xch1 TaxID=2874283 RepID=UPI001CBE64AE|nr:4Fe-4S dicluster domain-containing protein [Schnuerera sp. xch1]MBZ2174127.1 4Fe-4S dicluster domain-containing protein [Schnuerera sp. xch1]